MSNYTKDMLSSYHLIFDVTSSFQLPEAFQTFNVPFQWVETNWVLQGSTKSKNVVDMAQDSIVFHIVVLKAKRIVWTSLRYLDEIPIKYQSILLASVHPHGTSEGSVKHVLLLSCLALAGAALPLSVLILTYTILS